MSVCGRSFARARHCTACWRTSPLRGRCRSQSAWSGRYGWVLKTTSRASTPLLRSACTFVQPTPARLTGQCVTRSATSAAGEEEVDLVPALDLAAVAPVEVRLDGAAAKQSPHVGLLRATVHLCAGRVLRNGGERIVHLRQLLASLSAVGKEAAVGTAKPPDLRWGLAAGRDRDLEHCRRAELLATPILVVRRRAHATGRRERDECENDEAH